jgi:hypothetical protein
MGASGLAYVRSRFSAVTERQKMESVLLAAANKNTARNSQQEGSGDRV